MDDLKIPESLKLLLEVRRALEKNVSIHIGIRNFLKKKDKSSFSKNFQRIYEKAQGNHINDSFNLEESDLKMLNPKQRSLVNLILRGVLGHPIYENLRQLEDEIILSCHDQIKKHVLNLPLKLQIPMLLLIFPAIMLLILVPALKMLNLD